MRRGEPWLSAWVIVILVLIAPQATAGLDPSIERQDRELPKGMSKDSHVVHLTTPYHANLDYVVDVIDALPPYAVKVEVGGEVVWEYRVAHVEDAFSLRAALVSFITREAARDPPTVGLTVPDVFEKIAADVAIPRIDSTQGAVASARSVVEPVGREVANVGTQPPPPDASNYAHVAAKPRDSAPTPGGASTLDAATDNGVLFDADLDPDASSDEDEVRLRVALISAAKHAATPDDTPSPTDWFVDEAQDAPAPSNPSSHGPERAAIEPSSARAAAANAASGDDAPPPPEFAPANARVGEALRLSDPVRLGAAVAAAGAAGLVVVLAFLLWSHRQSRSEMLTHPNRAAIYAAIEAEPGIHLVALAARANLDLGVVRYHANLLEKAGLVGLRRVGRYTAHFTAPSAERAFASEISALKDATRRTLAESIMNEPRGLTQKELAAILDVSQRTVSHHLMRLESDGLVTSSEWPRRHTGTARLSLLLAPVSAPRLGTRGSDLSRART